MVVRQSLVGTSKPHVRWRCDTDYWIHKGLARTHHACVLGLLEWRDRVQTDRRHNQLHMNNSVRDWSLHTERIGHKCQDRDRRIYCANRHDHDYIRHSSYIRGDTLHTDCLDIQQRSDIHRRSIQHLIHMAMGYIDPLVMVAQLPVVSVYIGRMDRRWSLHCTYKSVNDSKHGSLCEKCGQMAMIRCDSLDVVECWPSER